MKFMLPNYFGIYLHDVPDKSHFADEARWLSNGCVRLEDAERLAKWIFGRVLKAKTAKPEERVDLPQPIPVYVTYLTVDPGVRNAVFRSDPYDYDTSLMAQFAPAGGPAIPTP
jgi:murein L,D-transpeptidase YcbB/YkuD